MKTDFWEQLSTNKKCWISNDDLNEQPSVISFEYFRLQEACENENPYAVQLLIKDLMEALLKFEILLVCAWAQSEDAISDDFTSVIAEITKPNIVLGDWDRLGFNILQHFHRQPDAMGMPLLHSLGSIHRFYEKENFVNWRNESIAHGALSFPDDEEFRRQIVQKLTSIKNLFESINADLKCQQLLLNGAELKGPKAARNLGVKDGTPLEMMLTMANGERNRFCVAPFIVVRSGGIYFFDNQKRETITQRLSYTDGRRAKEHLQVLFVSLFKLRNDNLHKPSIDTAQSVTNVFLTQDEASSLNLLRTDNYCAPEFLTNWLRTSVASHSKGVFYLEMPRGTGKSTYTEMISSLTRGAVDIRGLDVRTYHFHRSQLRNHTEDFEYAIEHLWAQTYGDAPLAEHARIHEVGLRSSGKEGEFQAAKAMADYLQKVCSYTRSRRGKNGIMLVLDGLDEIVDDLLWSYIPAQEELTEGVYILLTARMKERGERLPCADTLNGIASSCTESLKVAKDSVVYLDFLRTFIKQQIQTEESEREALLQCSDQRILYLKLLCSLINGGMEINTVLRDTYSHALGSIPAYYLNALCAVRSEADAGMLNTIVAFLCSLGSFTALTLGELAALIGLPCISFNLIAAINDLEGLLKKERGLSTEGMLVSKGNHYRISNPELERAIWQSLPLETTRNVSSHLCSAITEAAIIGRDISFVPDEEDSARLKLIAYGNVCRQQQKSDGIIRDVNLEPPEFSDIQHLHGLRLYIERVVTSLPHMRDIGCRICLDWGKRIYEEKLHEDVSFLYEANQYFLTGFDIAMQVGCLERAIPACDFMKNMLAAQDFQNTFPEMVLADGPELLLKISKVYERMHIEGLETWYIVSAFTLAETGDRWDIIAKGCTQMRRQLISSFSFDFEFYILNSIIEIKRQKTRSYEQEMILLNLYLQGIALKKRHFGREFRKKVCRQVTYLLVNRKYCEAAADLSEQLIRFSHLIECYTEYVLVGRSKAPKELAGLSLDGTNLCENVRRSTASEKDLGYCTFVESTCKQYQALLAGMPIDMLQMQNIKNSTIDSRSALPSGLIDGIESHVSRGEYCLENHQIKAAEAELNQAMDTLREFPPEFASLIHIRVYLLSVHICIEKNDPQGGLKICTEALKTIDILRQTGLDERIIAINHYAVTLELARCYMAFQDDHKAEELLFEILNAPEICERDNIRVGQKAFKYLIELCEARGKNIEIPAHSAIVGWIRARHNVPFGVDSLYYRNDVSLRKQLTIRDAVFVSKIVFPIVLTIILHFVVTKHLWKNISAQGFDAYMHAQWLDILSKPILSMVLVVLTVCMILSGIRFCRYERALPPGLLKRVCKYQRKHKSGS